MIGRRIGGRYRLVSSVGEGGMATIWRAVDEQLDREVAVKLLRPQFSADAGFSARFKAEARAAGSLSHPNIVPVYDYGTDSDSGDQYIVMELVEGRDLSTILKERVTLSTEDAVRLSIAVASALEAAHRRGIVHRDVKPGNILVTDDGAVKVTDFGIARAVSEASMTVTGTTLGSVHYFSPEQARGDEVTGASDVYALGIVLFEMLTGRRPFEGDSAAAVALRRLTEDAPTPTSIGRPVPPGLEAILMRALQREARDRFPDAGAFAEALRVWRRDPNAVPPTLAGTMAGAAVPAAMAGVARTPVGGEPTVYVPPRVARPPDRRGPPPRAQEQYPDEREGQPWWTWLLVLLGLVLLGAIGFLAAQLLVGDPQESPSPSVAQVEVPNWIGERLTAVEIEAERIGLELDVEETPSDDVPEGEVMTQEPDPGTPVDRGSTVQLEVSSGPEEVRVPRLRGQTESQAQSTLEAAGLRLGSVTRENDPDVPEGSVIRSNPAEGNTAERGDQVDLVISRGPTPSPTPSATPTPAPTPVPTPPPTPSPEPTESPTPEPA